MADISFNIVRHLGVISQNKSGWNKELNLVSWNGQEAKYDIRDWSPDHQKMGKGITLTGEQFAALMKLAEEIEW